MHLAVWDWRPGFWFRTGMENKEPKSGLEALGWRPGVGCRKQEALIWVWKVRAGYLGLEG